MKVRFEDLVHAIVWYASNRGEKLTTLRIVKFLYLADLYHARVSRGETLTGWPWAFVYFGPWCQQANEAISNAATKDLVIAKEYPSITMMLRIIVCSGLWIWTKNLKLSMLFRPT